MESFGIRLASPLMPRYVRRLAKGGDDMVGRYAAWCSLGLATLGASANGLELSDCSLEALGGRIEVAAECGTLAVPLDPDEPAGATIDLFVARVKAVSDEKEPDPLTVIAGGPGDASTRFFAMGKAAFNEILQTRDVILVDQRGTGASVPMTCPNMAAFEEDPERVPTTEESIAATLQCLDDFAHDPAFFTTSVAVRDLDQVRTAFGVDVLNIYGISYGTRVAQHYLRRYPEHTRRVILDGLVPAVGTLGPDIPVLSDRALRSLFARCDAEDSCREAFPDLESRFEAMLEDLRREPRVVSVAHPRTAAPTPVTVSPETLGVAVRLMLYNPTTMALLPSVIDAAYEGRYQPLATQMIAVGDSLGALAQGLNFAVLCTEDAPFWGAFDRDAQARSYMGADFMGSLETICREVPRGFMDDDFKAPLESHVPALFLSGEHDPITPPTYVPEAAPGFANRVEIVGAGQGHGLLGAGCIPRVMTAFIQSDDPSAIDTSCAERIGSFPFFVSPNGPKP